MPLVAHNDLPTFKRLKQCGATILSPNRAVHQDIRELHIGLLNMMPDAALTATERQFFRLIGQSNHIAQFYLHPFSFAELDRSETAKAHVAQYYETFEQIKQGGLDALIITGANVTQPDLAAEPFWHPLREVFEWATENVTSILCSCLATHAALQALHDQRRYNMGKKRWGVFQHRVLDRKHPLVADVNTIFDVPHSRFNNVSRQQFEAAGLHVLVESEQAEVHLAVSQDGFRVIYFQGHPEYDTISLLKEYKREVNRFISGASKTYPPFPDNYFRLRIQGILNEHRNRVIQALQEGVEPPPFPEELVTTELNNTWHDTAEAVINNWVGLVYQLTDFDRKRAFNSEVDPQDPLKWLATRS